MKKLLMICVVVLFTTNSYAASTLVYDGGGSQASIQEAMTELSIPFDLRGPGNPVTLADLASHDLLVIGFGYYSDMSGISASVMASGITGNILLTGHDPDFHSVYGNAAATTFLSQAISWARGSAGSTGLVALGDYSTGFSYLPDEWGVTAVGGFREDNVVSFTEAGLASGIYDGLTPADMSNWGESYHAVFTGWGPGFMPFEIGKYDIYIVTIGIPEPATILLLGLGGLALFKKRRV